MMRNELADQIWERHQARQARNRRLIGLGGVGMTFLGLGAAALWPKPAMALEDVVKATLTFNSIQWTQKDEGTIRDLGSHNPKTVPAYRQLIRYYASVRPADLQQALGARGVWKGTDKREVPFQITRNGKSETIMVPAYQYHVGPSTNLSKEDVLKHMGDFTFTSEYLMESGAKGEETQLNGKTVIRFHSVDAQKYIVCEDEIFADPKTKRMVLRKFSVRRPSGEKLFFRIISDVVYDGPKPK